MAAAHTAQNRALTAVVAPVVARSGLDLESVTVRAAGRRRQVRIVVDEPGGLSLDRVAAISRDISAALDASDVLGETPYVLEVTSPGIGRPLVLPRHWANAAGRLVSVRTRSGREFTGRVTGNDEASVTLAGVTLGGPDVRVMFAEIARATVQVEFSKIAEVDLGDDDDADTDGAADIDTANIDTANIDTANIDTADIDTADIDHTEDLPGEDHLKRSSLKRSDLNRSDPRAASGPDQDQE